ncbi:FIG00741760: hypothetical protein [hydrothermal vent metagenome]|uniref:DUF1638 domain-containing protein n=1 Tax=hydrothermal vent metagenome TaxID=652676 RepID=A0A3B0U1W7_9ZZZZ
MPENAKIICPQRLGIVACGALAREIEQIIAANDLDHLVVRYLPAKLHNTPLDIPGAVAVELKKLAPDCDKLLVAYGDCGTAGKLDVVLEQFGATRLKGAHCYAFFSGLEKFDALHEASPGTFYLTDYLARQFDTLVYKPLGLERHPELLESYFSNYTRLLYLAQSDDPKLDAKARDAAKRLGLRFERLDTGFGLLETTLRQKAASAQQKQEHAA